MTPGAESTTDELRSENGARTPESFTAATDTTPVNAAGYEYGVYAGPGAPLLPADATTRTPRDTAYARAACMARLGSAEPRDMLITPAPWLAAYRMPWPIAPANRGLVL